MGNEHYIKGTLQVMRQSKWHPTPTFKNECKLRLSHTVMEETQRKVTNVKFPKTLAAKRWQKGENQNSLSRGDDFQLIGLRQETAADGGLRQR